MTWEFFVVIVLALCLGVVLRSYDSLSKEVGRVKKEKSEIEDKARKHAAGIVEQAKDKALEIVEGAKIDLSKEQQEVEQKLEKITAGEVSEYRQTIRNVSNVIKDEAMRELDNFRKALELETVETQKIVSEKIRAGYEAVSREIDEYKQKRFDELGEEMRNIMKQVSRTTIGRAITSEEHTQLVVKALEEAKKQHVV